MMMQQDDERIVSVRTGPVAARQGDLERLTGIVICGVITAKGRPARSEGILAPVNILQRAAKLFHVVTLKLSVHVEAVIHPHFERGQQASFLAGLGRSDRFHDFVGQPGGG